MRCKCFQIIFIFQNHNSYTINDNLFNRCMYVLIQTYVYKCLSNLFILRQHIYIILNYPINLKMNITITSLTMRKWFSRTIEAMTKYQEVVFSCSAFEKFMNAMERFLFVTFTCILALGLLHFVSLMCISILCYSYTECYTSYYLCMFCKVVENYLL